MTEAEPARDFNLDMHLLRDRGLQSIDIEVERLQTSKLAYIDYVDQRIASLLDGKVSIRAATDPILGLPKLPEILDDDVLRIANRFGLPKQRQLTTVIPKPPREAA